MHYKESSWNSGSRSIDGKDDSDEIFIKGRCFWVEKWSEGEGNSVKFWEIRRREKRERWIKRVKEHK